MDPASPKSVKSITIRVATCKLLVESLERNNIKGMGEVRGKRVYTVGRGVPKIE